MKTKPSAKTGAIRLRVFRIGDYDEVFKLWQRTEGIGLNESDTRPAIGSFLLRNPGLSFVALKEEKMVGAVLCGHDGRRGYLHHLAVAKRHRKQGIGIQLVNACLARLRAADIHKCNIFIYSGNKEGAKFWERCGWEFRADLRLMQIRLNHGCGSERDCSC